MVKYSRSVTESVTERKRTDVRGMGENTAQSRRADVLNAACEAFARHGYRKASMQDVAAAAGVSKSVLFKYYGTKENLYRAAFRYAADGISAADSEAQSAADAQDDVFAAMRRTVDARMKLFARSPWVYSFSYAAAFDGDPFARALVAEEYARRGIGAGTAPTYKGIRGDVPPAMAGKLLFWVSQGFLEEKLKGGMAEPEELREEFETWIDLLERLLKEERT